MTATRNSTAGAMLAAGILALTTTVSAQSTEGDGQRVRTVQAPTLGYEQDDTTTAVPAKQAGQALAPMLVPIHTAEADLGVPYGIWAAADSYKVSFHGDMTFVPYLGEKYPCNRPFSWHTTSAKVGGVELVEPGVAPARAHGDYRYEYRFGAITEAYDVRADGLEQTFVLHQRPAAGDLVIRGAVTSTLTTAAVKAANQSLVFADAEGHRLVEYGSAVAIDAAGNRVPVDTSYAEGVIALSVPGAWLATAAMPVTVDPLVARVQVSFSGFATYGDVTSIDIGRDDDATSSNMMFAYSRAASATDSDAYARLTNDDYSGTTQVFTDVNTSWSTDGVACAFVGGSTKWAVVFRRRFDTLTPVLSQIRCHVHTSGDTTLLTNYGSLTPPSQSNDWRPDVGGVDAFQVGNDACVVFQREDNSPTSGAFGNVAESQTFSVLLDTTTANGTFGTPVLLYNASTSDVERPSVNQVADGGASFSWVCVMQAYNNSITPDDWDLVGRRIGNTGTISSNIWASDFALQDTDHQLGPVVEGQRGRYAVFFATTDVAGTAFKTSLIAGKSLWVERFDWANGANSPGGNKAPQFVRGNSDRRWESTGLAFDTTDDSHFGLGYRAVSPGVPVAYASRVGYNGALTEGPSVILYNVSGETPSPVRCVYDNDARDFKYAYAVDDGTTTNHSIYGQTYTYDAVTAWSTVGTACGPVVIGWSGTQQIGAEFSGVYAFNTSASAGHFLVVSLATYNALIINPAVVPGCSLLVDAQVPNYLGTMPFMIGSSPSWRFSLPEWLGPMNLYFQDWVLENNQLTSSQRLTVPLTK
ncbi:MAG: hypothetical protein U1E73_00130 [Planctomycetota bacterium]